MNCPEGQISRNGDFSMKIDDIDNKIISLLKQNARISNTAVAKEIGLTEGAVRHRIDQLIKQGAISKFTIEISSGNSFFAIVMLKAKHDVKKMMKDIATAKIGKTAYEISGDFDGCLVIEAEKMDDIDGQIDQLRQIKSVSDTKTHMVLKKW